MQVQGDNDQGAASATGRKRSWFLGVPGLLGGIAAIITAIGGLAVFQHREAPAPADNGVTLAAWAAGANTICSDMYSQIRALGLPPDPVSQFEATPQVLPIVLHGNQEIAALERPKEQEKTIAQLLEAASAVSTANENAYRLWLAGNQPAAQEQMAQAQRELTTLQRLDNELGANVCAAGA